MNIREYVAQLRIKLDCTSDYKLALVLGLAPNVIARYTKGGTFDNVMCVRVAEILDVPPLQVIADMERERAKTDREIERWKTYLERFTSSNLAACVVSAALLLGVTHDEFSAGFILCKQNDMDNSEFPLIPLDVSAWFLTTGKRWPERAHATYWRILDAPERIARFKVSGVWRSTIMQLAETYALGIQDHQLLIAYGLSLPQSPDAVSAPPMRSLSSESGLPTLQ